MCVLVVMVMQIVVVVGVVMGVGVVVAVVVVVLAAVFTASSCGLPVLCHQLNHPRGQHDCSLLHVVVVSSESDSERAGPGHERSFVLR